MGATEHLRENLQLVFELPADAIAWLLAVWNAIQVFDDVADGDPVARRDLDAAIWDCLVGISQNSFWKANSAHLGPVVATMILKWQASDTVERAGNADAMSFVWRAGYYDLILICLSIVHGPEFAATNSHHVMALYGESLNDYLKEFNHA
jgi:hypothetical protein